MRSRVGRGRLLLFAIAPVALVLWTVPAAGAAVTFAPPISLPTFDRATSVAVGDFNADGDPDLAAALQKNNNDPVSSPGSVGVRLGEAGAGFGAQTRYPVGPSPTSVAVGDFNGDGDPDLVVVNRGNNTVSVLLGAAGGGFGAQTRYNVGTDPVEVAVGDFNGDADPDLAVANRGISGQADATVSVLLGGADGGFGAPTSFPVGHTATSVAVGEFNGDGDRDLVVADGGNDTVSVLLGGADGGFGAPTTYAVGDWPTSVAVGDFDGDGDRDLAVANSFPFGQADGTVSVLLGGAGGGFGAQTTYPVGRTPESIRVGDLNGDGDPDLAVANRGNDTVSVLLGGAGGGFGAQTTYPVGLLPESIAVADFEGDGDQDLAVAGRGTVGWPASGTPRDISVLLNGPAVLDPWVKTFQPRPDRVKTERKIVTLTNLGADDLTISGVAIIGPDASSFPFRDETCIGVTLATDESCTALVRFRPLGTGPKSARVRFTDSANDSPQSVPLSGTGTPGPWLGRSAQALTFGKHGVGTTSAEQTVTFTNIGSASMSISGITVEGNHPGDYVGLSETCTAQANLDPAESCSARVAFRPTATGFRPAVLAITDTAPRSPHHVGLRGTGR